MSNGWIANLVNLLILALLPIYIGVHTYFLPASLSIDSIAESGFVSIITLTFIAAVFITLLTLIFNPLFLDTSRLTAAASSYVVLIYFLHEANMHRVLNIEYITQGKFYTMENVPMWQKTIAALVLVLLAIFLIYLLFKYARLIWAKIRAFEPWAVAFFLWFVVLFISQLSDKSGLNHMHIGRVIKECCECWGAIFIFLATIQIIPTLKQRTPIQYGVTAYDVMRNRKM